MVATKIKKQVFYAKFAIWPKKTGDAGSYFPILLIQAFLSCFCLRPSIHTAHYDFY